jgi:hypothetical protein
LSNYEVKLGTDLADVSIIMEGNDKLKMLENAHLFCLSSIEKEALPDYKGIYVWYLDHVEDGITYIGEANIIRNRLTDESGYFNNKKWNCYNIKAGLSFPAFLADYLDSKSKTKILEDDKIFIPNQQTSLLSWKNWWSEKVADLKDKTKILTFQNVSNVDNKKIEAFLIDRVTKKYQKITGKDLYVKWARKSHTQIGQIQGGPRETWPKEISIDFRGVSIPDCVKCLLL